MTLTAELMARFLAAAVRFSGLPAIDPTDLPEIEQVSAQALAQKVCPDAPGTCNSVAALFDTESYRIYLRESLNPADPMDNSFIVHELVHVLQFKKFGHDHSTAAARCSIASSRLTTCRTIIWARKASTGARGFCCGL